MPVFLLIPAVAAVASYSTGTLVASITGGVTGGFLVGGGVAYAVLKAPKSPQISNEATARSNEAKKAKETLPPKLTKVAEEVKNATTATAKAVTHIDEATAEFKKTSIELNEGIKRTKQAQVQLDTTTQELGDTKKELAEYTKKHEELLELLKQREEQIKTLTDQIHLLNNKLDTEVIVSTELEKKLELLTNDKAELLKVIAKQQEKIDFLEPKNKQLAERMRFFKQASLKTQTTEQSNEPSVAVLK